MFRFTRNTLLNYIPDGFKTENEINNSRIHEVNKFPVKTGYIVYLCEREMRAKDNFALQFAFQKSRELNLPIKIIHPRKLFQHKPKQNFIDKQILQAYNSFQEIGCDFQIINRKVQDFLQNLDVAMLIIDFNPILNRSYLNKFNFKIYEIDGHNIIPARFISNKQEYNAATFRQKIYSNIYSFLTEFNNPKTDFIEADSVLTEFIQNKLQLYSEFKNNPSEDILSRLSAYLNLGFISSQRAALYIIKSNASDVNKETFLEELIVRKELADNFCLYAKNFKNFSSIPNWARTSLNFHKYDLRTYTYSQEELESAKTHDKLWNATQIQLIQEGRIHGYLRMYWAKKLAEWTATPQKALYTAIYLNDKYGYDAPSPNGYTGILWAIGALHDRAFADHAVTGKIRRMTYSSIKRKYNLSDYMKKYLA